MKKMLLVLVILLGINLASAITIEGDVYGGDFEIVKDVLVKVSNLDGNVIHSMIFDNGRYSFNLDSGKYILEAQIFEEGILLLEGNEQIEVNDDDLVIDLIVLPIFDDKLFDDFELDTDLDSGFGRGLFISLIMIVILILIYYLWKKGVFKKSAKVKKEELPKDLKEAIKIIEKKGGRINQVDLRKELPYSEAKVSLMITDLEEIGLIKRIKKGRGNVLVLK